MYQETHFLFLLVGGVGCEAIFCDETDFRSLCANDDEFFRPPSHDTCDKDAPPRTRRIFFAAFHRTLDSFPLALTPCFLHSSVDLPAKLAAAGHTVVGTAALGWPKEPVSLSANPNPNPNLNALLKLLEPNPHSSTPAFRG